MWENIVERDRLQVTVWRMRIACWIPKGTDTHSEYVPTATTVSRIAPHCYIIRTLPVLLHVKPAATFIYH